MKEKLIEAVQKKYGSEIVSRGDCEKLSEVILEQTSENINYNTLRRIYGLAKPVRTRRDTLDILSRFVGYKSFYNFVNQVPKEVSWESRLNLYLLIHNNDTAAILSFFKEKAERSEDIVLPVIHLIREYLIVRKIKELNVIFNSSLLVTILVTYKQKLIIGNSVGVLLRNLDLNKKEVALLAKTKFFRIFIFEIFVDYSYLNGYYADFLSLLIKKRDYKNKLFLRCLLNLKSYLNNSPINIISLKESELENLHPILRGRYFSNFLLSNEEDQQYFFKIESFVSNQEAFQAYYEPMLISLVTCNTEVKHWLMVRLEEPYKQMIYTEPHYIMIYLLMKAHYYFETGEINKSKEVFESLNIDDFILSYKSFLLFFYYMLGFRLYKTAEMKKLMKQSLKSNAYRRLKYISEAVE